jgi:PAS domain S-box-containing protein
MNKTKLKKGITTSQVVIILAGFLLTFVSWYLFKNSVEHSASSDFKRQSSFITNQVKARVNRDILLLYNYKGFFASSKSVERDEFYTYTENLDLAKNYPGIFAVYYVQVIPSNNQSAFVDEVRKDESVKPGGYPDFKIYPESDGQEKYVAKYAYPEKENEKVLGFDSLTDKIRGELAKKVRDSGVPAISEKVDLLSNNVPGFIFLIPIYQNNASVATVEDRRANLAGFVAFTARADKFFSDTLSGEVLDKQNFDLTIFDSTPDKINKAFVYYDFNEKNNNVSKKTSDLVELMPLTTGDRTWTLKYSGSKNYGLSYTEKIFPGAVLAAGSIFFIFLFLLLRSVNETKLRASRLAEKMTVDLRESEEKIRAITQSAKDAIIIMDDKARVVLWGRGAENMFGYKESEMLGKEFHSVVAAEKAHQTKKDNLLRFGKTGESSVIGKNIELQVKDRTGKIFTVELTVSRIKIKDKWHAVGIMRDITERKKSEIEISDRASKLERVNRLMIGRELKMIELKNKIDAMEKLLASKKQKN